MKYIQQLLVRDQEMMFPSSFLQGVIVSCAFINTLLQML